MKLFSNRTYKSGVETKWCVFRWSDAQEPYLTRLFLLKAPWFAVCLNWIKQPDKGDPHDHTSAFLSFILKGYYVERRLITRNGITTDRWLLRRFWNYMRGCDWDAHRILLVAPGGALTLCFMGPKVREWFYHMPDGRVHWRAYEGQE